MSQAEGSVERRNVRSSRTGRIDADRVITHNMSRDEQGKPLGRFLGHMQDVRYGEAVVTSGVGTDLITNAARAIATGLGRLVRASS